VHGIEKGSTSIRLGMFENSYVKAVQWIAVNKRIYKYKVLDINVNDSTVYEITSKKKILSHNPLKINDYPFNKFKLREILESEGFTQAQLSRASGVSITSISHFTNHLFINNPTIATKKRIVMQ
jgi:hypothetical protein